MNTLTQTVEWNPTAGAYARYDGAHLVKHYDDKQAAILDTLPEDLKQWAHDRMLVMNARNYAGRIVRAAVYLAEGRVTPSARFTEHYDVRGSKPTPYLVHPNTRTCPCPDRQQGWYCKHLLAANHVHAGLQVEEHTIYGLAIDALDKPREWVENTPHPIWSMDERSIVLVHLFDDLYIRMSGHRAELRFAKLIDGHAIQTADAYQYTMFVEEIRKTLC